MKSILIFILMSASVSAQQGEVIAAFLEKWDHSKKYMLAVAQAMPDSLYGYRPTAPQMTFSEQLRHIQGNMDWLGHTYIAPSANVPLWESVPLTKGQLLRDLAESFDSVTMLVQNIQARELTETVDFFAGPKTKLQILNLLQDHVTHHRGQLIVYLNLNGIEPPKYVGW